MTQLSLDFTAAPTPQPETPPQKSLTLEMSRGDILGKALKGLDAEFVTLTKQGIWETDTRGKHQNLTAYPDGISVRGKGYATFKAELLIRILATGRVPRPSFDVPSFLTNTEYARLNGLIRGFGKQYVFIEIIDKNLELRIGNFTASIPTL